MTTYYDRIVAIELERQQAAIAERLAQFNFDAWLRFQRARQGSE